MLLNGKPLVRLGAVLGGLEVPISSASSIDGSLTSAASTNGDSGSFSPPDEGPDVASSGIFDAFASSPIKRRHGATSPVKSPSKSAVATSAEGLARGGSPAARSVTCAPAVEVPIGAPPGEADAVGASPAARTLKRPPALAPLVLDGWDSLAPAAEAAPMPNVFVPKVAAADDGAFFYH